VNLISIKMDSSDTTGLFIGFGAIILLILGSIWFLFGGEREGYIDTSDCRAEYEVEDQIWNRIFHEYTCSYTKTADDQLMSGICYRVKTTLFNNECKAAYYYEKKPFKYCTEDYPYLGTDGQCWNNYKGSGYMDTVYAVPEDK